MRKDAPDVREKLVDDVHGKLMGLLQRAPYIRCEDVHRQYAVNWLMNNGVTVQGEIDANTYQLMRECERLKEEKESLVNAINVFAGVPIISSAGCQQRCHNRQMRWNNEKRYWIKTEGNGKLTT